MTVNNLLCCDGEVQYLESFLAREEASHLFAQLQESIDWQHLPITIFGRQVMQPRLMSWCSDPGIRYRYSGLTMEPLAFLPEIDCLRKKIEKLLKQPFNAALLNYYRNGEDYMGWHQDNEKELGSQPAIVSISLGATRSFKLKHVNDKEKQLTLDLSHGSLLIMAGKTQECWKHSLPKRLRVKDPRINITFRYIKFPTPPSG